MIVILNLCILKMFIMARLHDIKDYDTENIYWGASTSLWFNGCIHKCKGCWNAETWNVDEKLEIPNEEVVSRTLEALDKFMPLDLTLLGGDPLAPFNIKDVTEIVEAIKKKRPHTRVLCWTGYQWNQVKHLDIMQNIDILVDGRYVQGLHVEGKMYGSSNQKVIDVKKSLVAGEIVLAPEEYKEED